MVIHKHTKPNCNQDLPFWEVFLYERKAVNCEKDPMKKVFIFLLLCVAGSFGYAQSKCNINRAWAFYTVSYPGVQMVDENGNLIPPKPMIDRFIYIEWCGAKKPEIKEVLYNNRSYDAVLEKVDGSSVIPGKDLDPRNKTRITAAKCKKLWRLVLFQEDQIPEQGSKQIVIKTKSPGACVFKLSKETGLMTLPRP